MKKQVIWMMVAILTLCGSAMMTSCSSNDDNPATPDLNLSEKIIGKWMPAELDGKPVLTDKKSVYTFVSPTKAYISVSTNPQQGEETVWNDQKELDVAISGNTMTLTNHSDEHTTMVEEFCFTAISGSEFTANHKLNVKVDGNVVLSNEGVIRFEKTTADYTAEILGLWECTGLTGIETYNDANARLEFLADGTYRYYRQDDNGQWQAVTTREFQDYFVDGTLLATRWKNQGQEELREWWEIASLADGQMQWTALRQNADGTTAQQGMTWKKIDLNIPEKIIGKWIEVEIDGQPAPNRGNSTVTFVSATKAYYSSSRPDYTETQLKWSAHREYDVMIEGNTVTLTGHPESEPELTLQEDFIITSITATEMVCKYRHTTIRDGKVSGQPVEKNARLQKTDVDYREAVVGTWEGQTSEGLNVRWQINADGTYVYARKVGDGGWETMVDEFNEYFADGYLFCARWKNFADGKGEQRQWWEIESIRDGVMKWKGLSRNADGPTYAETAELRKVADGTYRFYRKDEGGQWQAVTTREFQDYFVDGYLMNTRWKDAGATEQREWWEIASIADGQMEWTALRQRTDGTTFQQAVTWTKVE